MLQPQKAQQVTFGNFKRRYKRDATTSVGAISEMMQPQKALQARFCNLKRRYKRDVETWRGATNKIYRAENYLKSDAVKILINWLSARTLTIPKPKQTLTFCTDYSLHQWIYGKTKTNRFSKLPLLCVSKGFNKITWGKSLKNGKLHTTLTFLLHRLQPLNN